MAVVRWHVWLCRELVVQGFVRESPTKLSSSRIHLATGLRPGARGPLTAYNTKYVGGVYNVAPTSSFAVTDEIGRWGGGRVEETRVGELLSVPSWWWW
jgi:hypothetical protein